MTCLDVRDNLSAYLDGELDRESAAAVERHVAECAGCRAELESLREVAATVRALPRHAAPESVEREVVGALERDALLGPAASAPRRRFALPLFGGAAVAAALVVAVGIYVYHAGNQQANRGDFTGRLCPETGRTGKDDYGYGYGIAKPDAPGDTLARKPGGPDASPQTDDLRADAHGGANSPKFYAPATPAPATPAPALADADGILPTKGGDYAMKDSTALAYAAAPARPEVREIQLAAADLGAERARISAVAASFNLRALRASRLDAAAENVKDGRTTGRPAEGVVPEDSPTAKMKGRQAAAEDERVQVALDKVAQNTRTDGEYESTVGRLLDLIDRTDAAEAASPVMVLVVPEDRLAEVVAKLAVDQKGPVVFRSRRALAPAKAEEKRGDVRPADDLDALMAELDRYAAEDAEREKMAKETAGRLGEGRLAGKTRLEAERPTAPLPKPAPKQTTAEATPEPAPSVRPSDVATAPAKAETKPAPDVVQKADEQDATYAQAQRKVNGKPPRYVYLQILLKKTAAAAK